MNVYVQTFDYMALHWQLHTTNVFDALLKLMKNSFKLHFMDRSEIAKNSVIHMYIMLHLFLREWRTKANSWEMQTTWKRELREAFQNLWFIANSLRSDIKNAPTHQIFCPAVSLKHWNANIKYVKRNAIQKWK